jgi:hypothetical protein
VRGSIFIIISAILVPTFALLHHQSVVPGIISYYAVSGLYYFAAVVQWQLWRWWTARILGVGQFGAGNLEL